MNELALFAGGGGGILGGYLLGWRTVCAVEIEDYPRRILLARQRDCVLPKFPIWDDIRTFDGHPWRGRVDIVTGGFPCQDISSAGKGKGITGERSGLWSEMARVIRESGPRLVFVENSPMLTSRGLGRVLGDLAAMGYDAEWGVLGASDCGGNHHRKRIWILAHTSENGDRRVSREFSEAHEWEKEERQEEWFFKSDNASKGRFLPNTNGSRLEEWHGSKGEAGPCAPAFIGDWWAVEPVLGRVANGVADRVDRLKTLGNGQVPIVAATAFTSLARRLGV